MAEKLRAFRGKVSFLKVARRLVGQNQGNLFAKPNLMTTEVTRPNVSPQSKTPC